MRSVVPMTFYGHQGGGDGGCAAPGKPQEPPWTVTLAVMMFRWGIGFPIHLRQLAAAGHPQSFQIYSRGADRCHHRGRRLLHANPLRCNADPATSTLLLEAEQRI